MIRRGCFSKFGIGSILRTDILKKTPVYACRYQGVCNKMDLNTIVSKLEQFAPTSLAESWDNVGLLVEPSHPHTVNRMFLTNDLTEDVLNEAIEKRSDFILSYHPPIFTPLKRLTSQNAKERIIVRCLESRIAVYSPHTCYDAVQGGVNDWLSLAIGKGAVQPIQQAHAKHHTSAGIYRVETHVNHVDDELSIILELGAIDGVDIVPSPTLQMETSKLSMDCTEKGLVEVMRYLEKFDQIKQKTVIMTLSKPPIPDAGSGRTVQLHHPVSLSGVVKNVKAYLKLSHVRLAIGRNKTLDSLVHTAAVCAGSGSSVLHGHPADLYLTGEMSHHDVLDSVSRGTSVILCDHSNTERGFLSQLKDKLSAIFEGKVIVNVSEVDRDPLEIV